jgi:hypothetical protein
MIGDIMEEWKEDLLQSLLECGYRDLERLNEVLAIARKFNITIDDVLNYAEEIADKTVKFNDIIYSAMRLTLDRIAEELEEKGDETADKLRDWEIFINYMDSWFNIEALDIRDLEEIGKLTREQIVEGVKHTIR